MNILTSLCLGAAFLGASLAPLQAQSRAVSQGTRTQDTTVTSAGRPAVVTNGMPDGIARLSGAYYYLKAGKATLMTGPQRFAEGITFEPDGDLILKDGRKVRLIEGQMLTLAGELRDAPRHVAFPQPVPPPNNSGMRYGQRTR
jgi:hypothetical protein